MDSRPILATASDFCVSAISRPKPTRVPAAVRVGLSFRRSGGGRRTGRALLSCCSREPDDILKSEAKASDAPERRSSSKGRIHFVGVGGCGLSALAMLALKQGFEVSGSDIMWTSFMNGLLKAGATLSIGHSISNIDGNKGASLPKMLVISSAIPANNEEVAHARSTGIPIYKRDVWLRKVTEHYNLIAVSGTHGKSTTSAMLSYVLNAMGDNLIALVGANVPQFSEGNIIFGSGPNFVLEADEYDGCFLGLSPSVAIITNLEWEHVDIFKDEEAILSMFRRFLLQIKAGGHLILCGDSVGAYSLVSGDSKWEASSRSKMAPTLLQSSPGYSVTTYGISNKNDWYASSITPNLEGGQDYVLYYRECQITSISIALPGLHNVLNSLAVIATVMTLTNNRNRLTDKIGSLSYHLRKFEGVSRRFELVGTVQNCHIYEDYAHHPTEVRATLQAARQKFPYQIIWAVFQPHTFSRLAALMKDFATAFTDADHVIVTEVFAPRETNDNWNCDGKELASSISGPSSEYIPQMDVVDKLVLKISSRNQENVVLILGPGDVNALGPKLLRRLCENT